MSKRAVWCLAVVALWIGGTSTQAVATSKERTPKEECEFLMNELLPLARHSLSKHREFFPYGGTLSDSNKVAVVQGWTGDEHPQATEVIAVLEKDFRDGALQGRFKATALVVDMRVVPPGKSTKQDAIAVSLDHRGGYSVRVFFPYSFSPGGELLLERPFATPGGGKIFAQQ